MFTLPSSDDYFTRGVTYKNSKVKQYYTDGQLYLYENVHLINQLMKSYLSELLFEKVHLVIVLCSGCR